VLSGGGCTPAWDGTAPVASDIQVAAMISTVRQAGGDVGVSFGGFNGTELGLACGDASSLVGAAAASNSDIAQCSQTITVRPSTTTFTTGASTTSVTIFVHGWYGQGTVNADDVSVA
jgi:hypothetical protein